MHLSQITCPKTCEEMKRAYYDYYKIFYLKMVRMSNAALSSYVDDYLKCVREYSRNPGFENVFRTATGVISLHSFGYDDFNELSLIFDHVLPQTDPELVKYTSWCTGKLVNQSDLDHSRYVSRLLIRLSGWLHAYGRRERHLAAASLLEVLSQNSGSTVVTSLNTIQSAAHKLLTHPSLLVLNQSVKGFKALTQATMKYKRSELVSYLIKFKELCISMMMCGYHDQETASLMLLSTLIEYYPEAFTSSFDEIFSAISRIRKPPLQVRRGIIVLKCSMGKVDAPLFLQYCSNVIEEIDEIILEFPNNATQCLVNIANWVPEIFRKNSAKIKNYLHSLIQSKYFNESFLLLHSAILCFPDLFLPIDKVISQELINAPITSKYIDFFSYITTLPVELQPPFLAKSLVLRLSSELDVNNGVILFDMVTKMQNVFDVVQKNGEVDLKECILVKLERLTTVNDSDVKSLAPKAVFSVLKQINSLPVGEYVMKYLRMALSEPDQTVRKAILLSLRKNCISELATPSVIKVLIAFATDDAVTVRVETIKILGEIVEVNPMYVSGVLREMILDCFYTLKTLRSIRPKARIARFLPELIKASAPFAKVYFKPFLEIFTRELNTENEQCVNFIERTALIGVKKGLVDTLSLFAPLDKDFVSANIATIVTILSSYLRPTENQSLCISVLDCFFVLLSPPVTTMAIRTKCTEILSACSNLLAEITSLKTKIALFKVIGAIGVVDFHEKEQKPLMSLPPNIDESIARQFFQFQRDSDAPMDDSALLDSSKHDQYVNSIVVDCVMSVFDNNDLSYLFVDACEAMVQILQPNQLLSQFDHFTRLLISFVHNATEPDLPQFLRILCDLIIPASNNIIPYLFEILDIVVLFWRSDLEHSLLRIVLALLTATQDAFLPAFDSHHCVDLLIEGLENGKTASAANCELILSIFVELSKFAHDQLFLFVNQICDAVLCEHTLPEVRRSSLIAVTRIADNANLMPHIGTILRALRFCLDSQMILAFSALENLILRFGQPFIDIAAPLFPLYENDPCFSVVKRAIKDVQNGTSYHHSRKSAVISQSQSILRLRYDAAEPASEDLLISKARSPNFGDEEHLQQWLLSFTRVLIQTSPSVVVRTCYVLASKSDDIAMQLLRPAFLSTWVGGSELLHKEVESTIRQILASGDEYSVVGREILTLYAFMSKAGHPIVVDPSSVVEACRSFGSFPLALKIQEEILYGMEHDNKVTVKKTVSKGRSKKAVNKNRKSSIITSNLCNVQNTKTSAITINIPHPNQNLHSSSISPSLQSTITTLVDIHLQLGSKSNASSLISKFHLSPSDFANHELLTNNLSPDSITSSFNNDPSPESFQRMVAELTRLGRWENVLSFTSDFEAAPRSLKTSLAEDFANAAMMTGAWSALDRFLQFSPADSVECCLLSCLAALRRSDWTVADESVERGLLLLVSRPAAFWAERQLLHRDCVVIAQRLVEAMELRRWMQSPDQRSSYESAWTQRLKTAPRDFSTWFALIAGRAAITEASADTADNVVRFFRLPPPRGSDIHLRAFNAFFPKGGTWRANLCFALALWSGGRRKEAVEKIAQLRERSEGAERVRCNYVLSGWLISDDSIDSSKKAFCLLEEAVKLLGEGEIEIGHYLDNHNAYSVSNHSHSSYIHHSHSSFYYDNHSHHHSSSNLAPNSPPPQTRQSFIPRSPRRSAPGSYQLSRRALRELTTDVLRAQTVRKWGYVAAELARQSGGDAFAETAIECITRGVDTHASFPDVVQLLGLFFDHASSDDLFARTRESIEALPPRHLIAAAPQLIVQLSHPNLNVRGWVSRLVARLLRHHYHALFFEVGVAKESTDETRRVEAAAIHSAFVSAMPDEAAEVNTIGRAILSAAVSVYDRASQILGECLDEPRGADVRPRLAQIAALAKSPQCRLERRFASQFADRLAAAERLSSGSALPHHVRSFLAAFDAEISLHLSTTSFIPLAEVSDELCGKTHFLFAVPGTYDPSLPIIRIAYFFERLSVHRSRQQPKSVFLRGEDGHIYQYLLKGNEDLRLDERLMQFFNLANDAMSKRGATGMHLIRTMAVVPISVNVGLVQWVPSTDTFMSVVEEFRRLSGRGSNEEFVAMSRIGHEFYDKLLPVQKLQVMRRVFDTFPDGDVATMLWLRSMDAEQWLRATQTFTISSAVMSVVGYVIGLGDRHPSNILLDRLSGKAVHIDFGDSFERAMRRSVLPEVVPFRLTRMMVRAMGATGTDGLFRDTFAETMRTLRDNWRVLTLVLAIFVHEPIEVSTEEGVRRSESFSDEMRVHMKQKLHGIDFGRDAMSVEEQTDFLISEAKDIYNLSKMYSGWCAFW